MPPMSDARQRVSEPDSAARARSGSTPRRSRRNTRRHTGTAPRPLRAARARARARRDSAGILGSRPAVRHRPADRDPARAGLPVTGADSSPNMVARAQLALGRPAPPGPVRGAGRAAHDVSGRAFDAVVCNRLFHHFLEAGDATRRARRAQAHHEGRARRLVLQPELARRLVAPAQLRAPGADDHRPRRDPAGDAARGLRGRRPPARARDPRAPACSRSSPTP